jgi:cytochrome c556
MGDSLKAINRELKGSAPDVPRIQREAATLAALGEQISGWFPAGSGPDVHAKSRAKSEVWSDPQGFEEAHKGYLQQAQSFKRVADGGDVEQIRAAAQVLGKSCGTCHDKYRAPER